MGDGLTTTGSAKGQELLTALVKQEPGWLDRPIEDIVQMVDIGQVWLKAQVAVLKKIGPTDLEQASDYFKSRLETTRTAARGFFKGMEKIGEVRASIPKGSGKPNSMESHRISKEGTMREIGVSPYFGQVAEFIYENPDAVDLAFEVTKESQPVPALEKVLEVGGSTMAKANRNNRVPSVNTAAQKILRRLLEINMVLSKVVENLDQVKPEVAKQIHEALGRTVEIWTRKAPVEMKKLGRRIA